MISRLSTLLFMIMIFISNNNPISIPYRSVYASNTVPYDNNYVFTIVIVFNVSIVTSIVPVILY